MSNLLKFELQSIRNELETILEDKTITYAVHISLSAVKNNIDSALEMADVLLDTHSSLCDSTRENTAVAYLDSKRVNLIFDGRGHSYKLNTDDPKILGELLDTVALNCNSTEIEYVRIEVEKGLIDYSKVDTDQLFERLGAFSATTNAVVILPADLIVVTKKEDIAKSKAK